MLEKNVRDAMRTVRDEAAARGLQATLVLHRERSHLLRIGNNSVSLSTSEALSRLDVEVTNGRRQGSHTHLGPVQTADDVRGALDVAVEKSQVATPKDYDPLTDIVEESVDEQGQYDDGLAALDPAVKVGVYERIINEVGSGYNYSGSWSSGATEIYVVTTAGEEEAWHAGTDQQFSVVLKHPEQKWELASPQTGWRASDVTADASVRDFQSLLPTYEDSDGFAVDPGDYTVVFGATAIAEIMQMALWTGLFGRSWEEKQGWTCQNEIGSAIVGPNISWVDDPADANTFGFGFDLTGRRRRRFTAVEGGNLAGLVYDRNTAAKYGRQPTGHDVQSLSIAMAPGDGPADPLEAVKGMGRVLYIPALHYMHVPNPSQGTFTGSSRFSAVLVEDGRITRPIFSSRVTDSFQNVFADVAVIASGSKSVNTSNTYGRRAPTAMSVPAYMVATGVKITDCAESF